MKTFTEPMPEDTAQAGLTKQQFADRWNVSRRQVDHFLKNGMPHMRISYKLLRIVPSEGDSWLRTKFATARIGPANGTSR